MNSPKKSPLDRFLSLFSEVRAGEGFDVLLLLSNLLLVLAAYYVLKTVREPLIVASGGATYKTYASAVQAGVLVGFVPAYAWLAEHVPRIRLLGTVTLFFIGCMEAFVLAHFAGVANLGFLFYVWVGIFSVAIIAQFWSYANDLFNREQGERLFPIIAIGATVGGTAGARIAGSLFDMGYGPFQLLHVSAVMLLATLGLYTLTENRLGGGRTEEGSAKPEPMGNTGGGFTLVFRNPYLISIAALLIVLNMVNTTGEFVLTSMVSDAANAANALDPSVSVDQFIGSFYGDYFFWVNVGTVLIQAFVVSRIVRFAGIAGAVFALPLIALGAYSLIAAGVGLSIVRWAKSAENMTDYSVMNTAKAMLWLPATREEKYKAKAAIDTFFVRLGDVFAALLVFIGTSAVGLGMQGFVLVNLGLIALWMGIGAVVVRRYHALATET